MKLKVDIFQMDVRWRDKRTNLAAADDFIRTSGADLVILPEMFTTGFQNADPELAESMCGETLEWMRGAAIEYGRAIMGSIMVGESDGDVRQRFYNRLVFVAPDGGEAHYDKRHLFLLGGEKESFTPGAERVIVEYKGFRILPLVCYDLRFPVWSRGCNEFDLLVYVASWPAGRIDAWNILLRGRAVENQCYVAGVNRVGADASGTYSGNSCVVDYYGRTLAELPEGAQGRLSAELDRASLDRYREKFPAWKDNDGFKLD